MKVIVNRALGTDWRNIVFDWCQDWVNNTRIQKKEAVFYLQQVEQFKINVFAYHPAPSENRLGYMFSGRSRRDNNNSEGFRRH